VESDAFVAFGTLDTFFMAFHDIEQGEDRVNRFMTSKAIRPRGAHRNPVQLFRLVAEIRCRQPRERGTSAISGSMGVSG
jgi:hypothetical protein